MKGRFRAALLLLSLAALTMPCFAVVDPILVDPMYWVGQRTTPTQVIASDGWTEVNGGFKITWTITLDAGVYKYVYEIMDRAATTSPTNPEVSHVIFEVSPTFTAANILPGSTAATGGPTTYLKDPSAGTNCPELTQGVGTNPCMPADIFGLKFDFPENSTNHIVTLYTDRAPVWGDFYTKDGKHDSVVATAWNSGFGTDPVLANTPFNAWVPTPDTLSSDPTVPEPGTILLITTGVGALILGRHRVRRA